MYAARDKQGELYLFMTKPTRGCDEWQINDEDIYDSWGTVLPRDLFPKITWEDDPLEVELIQVHRIADEVLETIRENITSGYPSDLVDKHFNELI